MDSLFIFERHGGQFETLEDLDWKFVILVSGGQDHIFIRTLFVDNKKGEKYCDGMAWLKGKTRKTDLFHSGR